jgi:hypothetical protein
VYKEGDSPSKSKTRTNNRGNTGRYHHCRWPTWIKLKVISKPAIARNILLPVGLPSFLFFWGAFPNSDNAMVLDLLTLQPFVARVA